MRLHEPGAVPANLVRTQEKLGMDEIERADIEAGRHADLAAEGDHPLDEVEAGAAEIEATVDMRRLDVEKGFGGDRFSEADEQPHGEGRGGAVRPMQKRTVEFGEFETHLGRLAFCREPSDSFLEGPSAVRNQGRQAEISLLSSEQGIWIPCSARKIPCSTAQGILLEWPRIVWFLETVCPKMTENGEISLFFSLLPGNSSHSGLRALSPRELRPFARLARIEAFS